MSSCEEIVCSKVLQFLVFYYRKGAINVFDGEQRKIFSVSSILVGRI